MAFACIDIGSNTTRLLVAEHGDGGLHALLNQRAFTHIGAAIASCGAIAPRKIDEIAGVVDSQARAARALGVERAGLRAVATAAVRNTANRQQLLEAIEHVSGVQVEMIEPDEEARLAFRGATHGLSPSPQGEIAVVDVGGASSEIALGTIAGGARWSTSLALGSGLLADAYQRSDPPAAAELEQMRSHVERTFASLELPSGRSPTLALAVGGSAMSLHRMVGPVLDCEALQRAVDMLAASPACDVADRLELEPERVRLLAGGMLILHAMCTRLAASLTIGRGGLREGVVLELLSRAGVDRRHSRVAMP